MKFEHQDDQGSGVSEMGDGSSEMGNRDSDIGDRGRGVGKVAGCRRFAVAARVCFMWVRGPAGLESAAWVTAFAGNWISTQSRQGAKQRTFHLHLARRLRVLASWRLGEKVSVPAIGEHVALSSSWP